MIIFLIQIKIKFKNKIMDHFRSKKFYFFGLNYSFKNYFK